MLIEVPAVRTKLSRKELTIGFIKGWKKFLNVYPQRNQIAVIFAQMAGETGLAQNLWNYNVGNYKAVDPGPGKTRKYVSLPGVWEIINGKKVILPKEHPGSRFIAYSSLEEGVVDYLDHIKNKRFKPAWQFIENGDPEGFAKKLKELNYYTAPVETYIKSMKFFFNDFIKRTDFDECLREVMSSDSEAIELDLEPVNEIKTFPYVRTEMPTERELISNPTKSPEEKVEIITQPDLVLDNENKENKKSLNIAILIQMILNFILKFLKKK